MREGVTEREVCTSDPKEGRKQATWISGKSAPGEQRADADASGSNLWGTLAAPAKARVPAAEPSKGKVSGPVRSQTQRREILEATVGASLSTQRDEKP